MIAPRSKRLDRQDRGAISDYQRRVAAVVEALDEGEVVSFGDVAARAGHRRAARAAGTVLANSGDTLPWWRVVYADGHLPQCNPSLQAERLLDEGVSLRGFRVVQSPLGRFAQNESDASRRNRPAGNSR